MRSFKQLFGPATVAALMLAACGGGSAAPSSVAPASSAAAPKPAASASAKPAASTAASAKPAASGAASAKPAASASAKPAASGSAAAKPKPTLVPDVAADTTQVQYARAVVPGYEGKSISADILDIDQDTHMVYVADRDTSGLDVYDVSGGSPKFVKTLKTPAAPNGVIVAKNINRIAAGLNDGTLGVLDLASGNVVGTIQSGGKKRVDELDYDPKEKKVYAANSDDGFMGAYDPMAMKMVQKIDNLGDSLEQPRYDAADGMVYLTGSGTNTLFQVDPTKDAVAKKFSMPNGCNKPSGQWMNPKTNVGVISCDPNPIVWDYGKGDMVDTLKQTGKGDQVFYSAKADVYLLGEAGWSHGPHIGIVGGTPIKFITNVGPTPGGNHNNSVLDEASNMVYSMGPDGLLGFPLPKAGGTASAGGAAGASAKPAASAKPSA